MCFSVEADLVAGTALLPVAALSLREVRCAREVPFAALPLLFAGHQLVEAVVWAGAEGHVSGGLQHLAAVAYAVFALPVLPTLVPLAVLLLEPPGSARRRVAPFVGLGLLVSVFLAWALVTGGVQATAHPHAITYGVDLPMGWLWAGLYIVAVIGPSLLSGYRSIVAFGALNLVGLTVVAIVYAQAFASLWCIYAAAASVTVLVHMYRRRHLPDDHRLHGEPLVPEHVSV